MTREELAVLCGVDVLWLEKYLFNNGLIEKDSYLLDIIDWEGLSWRVDITEDFIREFQDRVDWHYISDKNGLSEDFIREFKDKVDWERISSNPHLSEEFIEEFKDKIDWFKLNLYHNGLSAEFKAKHNWRIRELVKDYY